MCEDQRRTEGMRGRIGGVDQRVEGPLKFELQGGGGGETRGRTVERVMRQSR